jgi:hypothetical protein
MQAFNIICAAIFALCWLALLIKGTSFMALRPLVRTAIMLAFAGFTAAWIIIDHIKLGS